AETVEMLEAYGQYSLDKSALNEAIAAVQDWHSEVRGPWADVIKGGDEDAIEEYYNETLGVIGQEAGDMLTNGMSLQVERAQADFEEADAQAASTQILLIVVLLAGLALGIVVALLVIRQIMRTVETVRAAVQALGEGDLTAVPEVTTHDELGEMAANLGGSMERLRGTIGAVSEAAVTIASGAEELSAATTQVVAASEETSAQSGVVASAAEQVSQNIQTVAAGAEQMGASIREIAQNAGEAAEVAGRATQQAATTNETVQKLGTSSVEIGNVIKVITSIAAQDRKSVV